MAEYIDRGKFLKECMKTFGNMGVTIKAIECIANECTADVVEVVRCRDCIYCTPVSDPIVDAVLEFCEYGLKPVAIEPNHFCGYGEREEQK